MPGRAARRSASSAERSGLIRAVVACGWFGVQTLFGGIAIHLLLSALFDGWAAIGGTGEVIGFFIFWVANIWIVIRSESIKHLEALAAPLLLVALGWLLGVSQSIDR